MRGFKPGCASRWKWLGLCAQLAWATLPGMACAGPDVDPGTWFNYLGPQRGTLVTRLRNQGDTTAFVTIELAELTFDEKGEPHERSLAEDGGFERALLVTPPRLIVPAGGVHDVRIIYRGPRTVERYFRVRYVPVAPVAGDSFALQPDEAAAYSEALRAGVGVLKAMGTLLIVQPSQPRYATRLEPGAQALRILNDGNATVRVSRSRYCTLNTEHCTLSPELHIRPGQAATIERRPGEVYRFDLIEGRQVTSQVYPRLT
jgi:hypothetical protein